MAAAWGSHDAHGPIELTPFRHKDALAPHGQAEEGLHGAASLDLRDYGLGGPPPARRPPRSAWEFLQHQGGWLLATAHIVTAIIGAGVLGLPYALSWLGARAAAPPPRPARADVRGRGRGRPRAPRRAAARAGWAGGVVVLLLFYVITLVSSLLLTECHETGGVKHETYRAAVKHVLGPRHAAVLSLFQYLNLVLSSIGYTVAAGQSLRILVGEVCSRSRFEACYDQTWVMSLVFGACQLLLSQLPSLEAAWWSSIVGAVMSFAYSTCALGLGAAQAHRRQGDLLGRPAPPLEKALNVFNALGSIAFAYNFTGVLMEIQATLHEPPRAAVNMRRAVHAGMGASLAFYIAVSATGYAALGNAVPGDILTAYDRPAGVVTAANAMVLLHMLPAYQVFSQPVFHGLEAAFTDHAPRRCAALPPRALRLAGRSAYVALTTGVAVVMPFFTDIIGLVGALVFWPAAVFYPVKLYSAVYRPGRRARAAMAAMNAAAAVTSVLAVVGASWNIRQHVGAFTLGWRT
ncbi:AAP2 [Scenedesmus sp. PABB004]|nr:AAP2 [Scenedesmus sp. PABB004]